MFDICYHQKESNIDVHQEGRRFKVDVQIFLVVMYSGTTIDLWLPSFFVKVAHLFNILGTGDGAGLTVASKNELSSQRSHTKLDRAQVETSLRSEKLRHLSQHKLGICGSYTPGPNIPLNLPII